MRKILAVVVMSALPALAAAQDAVSARRTESGRQERTSMFKPLAAFVAARQAEFDQIDPDRKAQLEALSAYVQAQRSANKPVRLLFVCTHNSRRSHMAQLWAAVAAEAYGIRATTYSGGTESTAFNPRAVAAMERAGFRVEKTTDDSNPVYHLRFSDECPAQTCFSKRFDNAPNAKDGFAAVMVCSEADKACPAVAGADRRFAMAYVDPKIADGTAQEAAAYDERCAQIAREMLYVMSRAAR
jgi:arsenate reductase